MVTQTRFKFGLYPVIERPKITAEFITDEAFYKEFKDRAVKKYNDAVSLKAFSFVDGTATGSNAFIAVLANELLRECPGKLRTATQADIETTLRADDFLGIKGNHYVDTALVLKSRKDSYASNVSIAESLTEQAERRLGRIEDPLMIPYAGFDLKVESNPYGLGFVLREDAELIAAGVLSKNGRFNSEDINTKMGLPNKTGDKGERGLHTRSEGVSGLCVISYLSLSSNWNNLDNSNDSGRVVVCGEAASAENLDKKLK